MAVQVAQSSPNPDPSPGPAVKARPPCAASQEGGPCGCVEPGCRTVTHHYHQPSVHGAALRPALTGPSTQHGASATAGPEPTSQVGEGRLAPTTTVFAVVLRGETRPSCCCRVRHCTSYGVRGVCVCVWLSAAPCPDSAVKKNRDCTVQPAPARTHSATPPGAGSVPEKSAVPVSRTRAGCRS